MSAESGEIAEDRRRLALLGAGSWALGLFLLIAGPLVSQLISRIRNGFAGFRFQWDNEEAAILYQVQLMLSGRLPYGPLGSDPPWVVGTYPPGYYVLVAPFQHFFGQSAGPDYFPARLVTALCIGACAVLAAWLAIGASRQTAAGTAAPVEVMDGPVAEDMDSRPSYGIETDRSWLNVLMGSLAALLAAGLFLTCMEVFRWSPYARVDFAALAFSMAGLVAVIRLGGRARGQWIAAALMVLAGYCKQSAVAAPVAVGLWLLLHKGGREALAWSGRYALLGVIPFILLTMATAGQFVLHTIIYNANTMSMDQLRVWVRHVWRFHPWLLAGGAVGVVAIVHGSAQIGRGRPAEKPVASAATLLTLWLGVAWLQFPSIAKAGAAENYLLEPLAATAVCIGAAWHLCALRPTLSRLGLGLALSVAVALHGLHLRGWLGGPDWGTLVYRAVQPPPTERQAFLDSLAEARRRGGPVLSEFGHLHLALGQPIEYQPFIMSELAKQGKWDPTPLLGRIESRHYSLIILERPVEDGVAVLTEEMIKAIRENYRLWPGSPSVRYGARTRIYEPINAAEGKD